MGLTIWDWPLGDTLNRSRFIPLMMGASAIALLCCAAAPDYWSLITTLTLVGATSLSGQLLLPLAGDLAKDNQRGQVIGTIASGMLIGIMLSRFVSGIMAEYFGWRAIYLVAGIVNICFALILYRAIPNERPRPSLAYWRLLTSILDSARTLPAVITTLAIGACAFCVFTMFWTGLTFLLSDQPFNFSVTQIGLVNLVGLVGAFAARSAGKLHDRGYTSVATGATLILALIALGISEIGSTSLSLELFAILLLNLAIQSVMVLNQTRLLTLHAELRSRLNTAFIVCNFIAGAIGSAAAGYLWQVGGWTLITGLQILIVAAALLFWVFQRKTAGQSVNCSG